MELSAGCKIVANPTPRTMYLAQMEPLDKFAGNAKNNNNDNNNNK